MKLGELTAQQLLDECLRTNTEEAWAEFIRRLHPLVSSVIVRTVQRYRDLSFSIVEDLIQETYLRLCRDNRRALREFQWRSDSAIFSFVKRFPNGLADVRYRARLCRSCPRRTRSGYFLAVLSARIIRERNLEHWRLPTFREGC